MENEIFMIGIMCMMLFNLMILSGACIPLLMKRKAYKEFVSTHKYINESNFFKKLGKTESKWYLNKIIENAKRHNKDNDKLMKYIKNIGVSF